jgi:hypothetical protein
MNLHPKFTQALNRSSRRKQTNAFDAIQVVFLGHVTIKTSCGTGFPKRYRPELSPLLLLEKTPSR